MLTLQSARETIADFGFLSAILDGKLNIYQITDANGSWLKIGSVNISSNLRVSKALFLELLRALTID